MLQAQAAKRMVRTLLGVHHQEPADTDGVQFVYVPFTARSKRALICECPSAGSLACQMDSTGI